METILITGAAGTLGSQLVKYAAKHTDCSVIAADIDKSRIPALPNIAAISNDELFALSSLEIDTIINCAFARGNVPSALVSALLFNERLISKIKEFNPKTIINISSQGLYKSLEPGQFASEESEIEPYDLYAFAKFAQERLFSSNFGNAVTNIRMASLSANARFLTFFVESVIQEKALSITAPYQYVSFLDISDAVEGILKLSKVPAETRKRIYNLGTEKQYSILEIAQMVNKIGQRLGYHEVALNVSDNGKQNAIVMDCSKMKSDTGWKPQIQMEDMIKSIYKSMEAKANARH